METQTVQMDTNGHYTVVLVAKINFVEKVEHIGAEPRLDCFLLDLG
jgi:hypothetical protein